MFRRWFAFGLYGLELHRAPWAKAKWIFRDVTLMSADPEDFLESKDDRRTIRALETAFGVAVWSDGTDHDAMQFGHLIRQPRPGAFLVVKKKVRGDDDIEAAESAAIRAQEVAAMLCLTRTFCTSDTAGVLDARSLVNAPRISLFARPWIDPESGRWGSGQEVHRPGWLRDPDVVDGPDLIQAVRQGNPIPTAQGLPWILAEAIPLVRILSHHHRTPAESRLVQAALHAYRAHHAGGPGERLVQSITALQVLFGQPTDLDKLASRTAELVQLGPASRAVTAHVFQIYAHHLFEGAPVSEGDADVAVHLAAAAAHAFAEALDTFKDTAAVVARLDLLAEITANVSLDEAQAEQAWNHFGPVAPTTRALFEQLQSATTANEVGTELDEPTETVEL